MYTPSRFKLPRTSRGTAFARLRTQFTIATLTVCCTIGALMIFPSSTKHFYRFCDRHFDNLSEEEIERRKDIGFVSDRSSENLKKQLRERDENITAPYK